jgi:peptidoglycan/xylan/chitin deacetylase (PgdA/CDA1 family)
MLNKKIVLTLDVEEFDVPLEYGMEISLEEQIEVSTRGLLLLKNLFEKHQIEITIFCTGQFALSKPELIKELSRTHEIASHGMFHSHFDQTTDLIKSKKVLNEITGQEISGFRMARLMPVETKYLLEAGYKYNASLNPTFIPGRYNHLNKPKTPFTKDGMLEVPITVSPHIRFPLFWLSFKNLPLWIYKKLTSDCLASYDIINLYFHPWEFTDLSEYAKIPRYVRRHSNKALLDRLDNYIYWLKTQNVEFLTMKKAYYSENK